MQTPGPWALPLARSEVGQRILLRGSTLGMVVLKYVHKFFDNPLQKVEVHIPLF